MKFPSVASFFLLFISLKATEPVINSLLPRGGQTGSTQEVEISGQRLADTEEIFFYSPGISCNEIVEKK